MISQIAPPMANVVPETPELDHGETADNPSPFPNNSNNTLSADAAKAPPSTGPQAIAETGDSVLIPVSGRVGTSTTAMTSSMPQKSENDDNRDRHAQQPQQNSST